MKPCPSGRDGGRIRSSLAKGNTNGTKALEIVSNFGRFLFLICGIGWSNLLCKIVNRFLAVDPSDPSEPSGWANDSRIGRTRPDLSTATAHRWPLNKRMDVAESILRNLGLTRNFARIVILCGHGADVVNNPYKAGLDCGACGGHSGEPNARIAAGILNDPQVREALHARGIEIPDDTFFIAAVHNTTTDEVNLFDLEPLPESHFGELALLEHWLDEAGELCRHERSQRMRKLRSEDLFRRSRDWSETRPEWGLANNAAFIIAPRSRTLNIDLGGRAFMHSYARNKIPTRSS